MSKLVASVDGCRHGWVVAWTDREDLHLPRVKQVDDFSTVSAHEPPFSWILVDIPIGLSEGPEERACDKIARQYLKPRRSSSVFPAPVRPALSAESYESAAALTRAHRGGKGLSRQSYGILKKVREVDQLMTPKLQERVRETHPELVFWAMNRGRALRFSKQTADGRRERLRLLNKFYRKNFSRWLAAHPSAIRADIIDALACLWCAIQWAGGHYARIPEHPPRDARQLRMELIYPLVSAQTSRRRPRVNRYNSTSR